MGERYSNVAAALGERAPEKEWLGSWAAAPTRRRNGRPRHSDGWTVRRFLLVGWDAFGWASALVLAAVLRNEFHLGEADAHPLETVIAVAIAAQVGIGLVLQTYRGRHCVGTADDAVNLTVTTVLAGVFVFLVDFFVQPELVPLSVPLLALSIAVLLAVGSRLAVRVYREYRHRPDHGHASRVIIYGAGIEGQQLLRLMLADPAGGYLPVALLDDDRLLSRRRISGVAVRGTGADVAAAAARSQADLLVIADRNLPIDGIREIASAATSAGLAVAMVPTLSALLRPVPAPLLQPPPRLAGAGRTVGSSVRGTRLGPDHLPPPAVRSRTKRGFDVVFGLSSLLVLLPLLLLIAVLLKTTSGEVFYRAPRIGRGGEPFTMFKFVTMVPGERGPRVTVEGDPRITRVGRWLRASKLNELPQILNVIKGDMSLVGPRPEDPRYTVHYSSSQQRVLAVRPGLTSRAFLQFGDEQAFIERARPSDIEAFYLQELLPVKLEIELQYVDNWSMREDLKILAGTVRGLLR